MSKLPRSKKLVIVEKVQLSGLAVTRLFKLSIAEFVCAKYSFFSLEKHNKVSPDKVKPRLMQDEALKKQIAAVLEIPEFDAEIMQQKLTHISILGDMLTFHFHDGHSVTQQYIPSKRKYHRKEEK